MDAVQQSPVRALRVEDPAEQDREVVRVADGENPRRERGFRRLRPAD